MTTSKTPAPAGLCREGKPAMITRHNLLNDIPLDTAIHAYKGVSFLEVHPTGGRKMNFPANDDWYDGRPERMLSLVLVLFAALVAIFLFAPFIEHVLFAAYNALTGLSV